MQAFKYNGKELDREHQLDVYDYGARMYAPAIGRFMTMDPLAEKYYSISPYAYCGNNPVNRIDPNGKSYTDFNDEEGNLIKHVDDGSNAVFKVTGKGINKHYEFQGFDDSQGGQDKVNLTTTLQEAQNLNNANSSLNPSNGTTYCNFATQNILKTVNSAINVSGTESLVETGMANTMANNFGSNSLLQNVTKENAQQVASQGGFVVFGYNNASGHGHVGTLAVGDNFIEGNTIVANIGATNGFLDFSKVFSTKTSSSVSFYTLTSGAQPKSLSTSCNVTRWFNK